MTTALGATSLITQSGQKGLLSRPFSKEESPLLAVIVFLLAAHLSITFQRAISWDEFWHYGLVEAFARGDHIQPLQTLYVRAFGWITYLPGSEIDHIIAVRVFMLACLLVTAVSIVGIVSGLSSRANGLICAACYLSAGYVLQHGTSFRTDTMAAALLSVALWILASSSLSWRSVSLIGLIVGAAGMVTIKAILWLPAFAGLGLIRWQASDWNLLLLPRFVIAGLVAAIAFIALFFLHASGLVPDPEASAGGIIENSTQRMFKLLYISKLHYLLIAALKGLPFAILIIVLPFVLLTIRQSPAFKIGLIGLWALAFVTLVYVNSYPYLYTFILPPVAVSVYYAADFARKRYGVLAIAALLAFNGAANWLIEERGILQNQRLLLTAVKQIMPGPVQYFDCCAMIGSWPHNNGFRTVWGVEKYLSAGEPQFKNKLLSRPVPLLFANDLLMNNAYQRMFEKAPAREFLAADAEALRETYIHFWGPVYLAGTDLLPRQKRQWRVLVPGTYTIEGVITINGRPYSHGQTLYLERGELILEEASGQPARLIWGEELQVPDVAAPARVWTGF